MLLKLRLSVDSSPTFPPEIGVVVSEFGKRSDTSDGVDLTATPELGTSGSLEPDSPASLKQFVAQVQKKFRATNRSA